MIFLEVRLSQPISMSDHAEGEDLMDEVLTLEGFHDIDSELDAKKELSAGSKPSNDHAMDSADFEQLLWQPTVEDGDAGLDDSVMKSEKELDISLEKDLDDCNPPVSDHVLFSTSDTLLLKEENFDDTHVEPKIETTWSESEVIDHPEAKKTRIDSEERATTPLSSGMNASGDSDDVGRKRKHSQISPIKWTASDQAVLVDEIKKPKPEKSEVEIERDSKLKYIFRSARFFIIKSNNHENVALSKARGIWSTMPQNEARLNQAYRQCCNVILIFSIRESGKFQGRILCFF